MPETKNMSLYLLHTQYNSITGPAQFRDFPRGSVAIAMQLPLTHWFADTTWSEYLVSTYLF